MTAIHKYDESEQYLAPRCKVFFVKMESNLLSESGNWGNPDSEDYDENELDDLN